MVHLHLCEPAGSRHDHRPSPSTSTPTPMASKRPKLHHTDPITGRTQGAIVQHAPHDSTLSNYTTFAAAEGSYTPYVPRAFDAPELTRSPAAQRVRTDVLIQVPVSALRLEGRKSSAREVRPAFDFAFTASIQIELDRLALSFDKEELRKTTFKEQPFEFSLECRSLDLDVELNMAALATVFDALVSSPVSLLMRA